jgi:nucleoside-diphosphate-sugar epimerase
MISFKTGDIMITIGMIGCGWLGNPLALHLNKTHTVQCYTRSHRQESNLEYVYLPQGTDRFWQHDLFIISISTKDNYLQSLKAFLLYIKPSASVILMSSTSVYKEFDTQVDETSQITETTLQKEAEDLALSYRKNLLILRLGGLMGNDRISGKWKSASGFTDGPVNYIHQEDILHIISKLIEKNIFRGVFNLVAPQHPLRSEVHKKNCKDFAFELGTFSGKTNRTVSSDKLIKRLHYKFIHPDPLLFWT